MPKAIDISGKRFGKLLAIKRDRKNNNGKWLWLCLCDCGNYTSVDIHSLLRKDKPSTKTCGKCKKSMVGKKCYKHGMSATRLYQCYKLMKNRCCNKHNKAFSYYGGKGITVCEEWLGDDGAVNFIKWALENGYKDTLTLDRIDNSKGYCPDNCRWVTRKAQANNLTNNLHIQYLGVSYTISEICEKLGLNRSLVYSRLRNGWDTNKAITTPKLR